MSREKHPAGIYKEPKNPAGYVAFGGWGPLRRSSWVGHSLTVFVNQKFSENLPPSKFNSEFSPEKLPFHPIGKEKVFQPSIFQGRAVKLREGIPHKLLERLHVGNVGVSELH